MRSKSGLSFVDVLIILAIILLLAALAIPRFIKAPDYGTEEDEAQAPTPAVTNAPEPDAGPAGTNAAPETAAEEK
jgi:hypothetical protein